MTREDAQPPLLTTTGMVQRQRGVCSHTLTVTLAFPASSTMRPVVPRCQRQRMRY